MSLVSLSTISFCSLVQINNGVILILLLRTAAATAAAVADDDDVFECVSELVELLFIMNTRFG